jgi:hypothetical protein
MQSLVGDDLALTQEFLAQTIGVQRSGVNAIRPGVAKPIREAISESWTDRASNNWHANAMPPSMRTGNLRVEAWFDRVNAKQPVNQCLLYRNNFRLIELPPVLTTYPEQPMNSFSIDQAREASLACSLTRLAIQQHKLGLEMAAIQQMRLQLRNAFNAVPKNDECTTRA